MKFSTITLISLAVVTAWAAYIHFTKDTEPCVDYSHGQVVLVDRDDEVMATILKSERVDGECFYKVTGQKGTEMPFTDYMRARDIKPYQE